MKELKIETKRGVLLDGVLFAADGEADTVLIAITGIHGNINSYMPTAAQNRLLFIERTGHTYQQKH